MKKPGRIQQFFFPVYFRNLPQRRLILNILRSIHILCFSILLGGVFFNQPASLLTGWMYAVVLSGIGLFLVDLYSSSIVLFEVRGLTVLIKVMLLLVAMPLEQPGQFTVLVVVVIFSSVVSHSPRRLRHKNLLPQALRQKYAPVEEEPARRRAR